jgi:hypothetical protein
MSGYSEASAMVAEFHRAFNLTRSAEPTTAIPDHLRQLQDAMVREVHRSNMSKLDDDGRPVLRADGKVLEPERYSRRTSRQLWSGSGHHPSDGGGGGECPGASRHIGVRSRTGTVADTALPLSGRSASVALVSSYT